MQQKKLINECEYAIQRHETQIANSIWKDAYPL